MMDGLLNGEHEGVEKCSTRRRKAVEFAGQIAAGLAAAHDKAAIESGATDRVRTTRELLSV
jgi:hypothetical protein